MLLGTLGARAQLPEEVSLRWTTHSECTRPLDLEWQIVRLLGPELTVAQPVAFEARVDVPEPSRHELTLRIKRATQPAVRHVVLGSCAEVQEAVAVLVAIALDPSAAMRAPPIAVPPPQPAPKPPPKVPAAPPPRIKPPRRPLHLGAALRVGAVGDLQSLPALTGGPSAGVELAIQRALRISLDGRYFVRRRADSEVAGVGARVELVAGGLGLAYMVALGAAALGPCIEAELGYLRAKGVGLQSRQTTGTLWIAGLAGARFDYSLTERVSLRFVAMIGAPMRHPRFALRPSPVFYETRTTTARIELGALFRLGSPK